MLCVQDVQKEAQEITLIIVALKKTKPLHGIREGVFTSQSRKYYEIVRVAKRKKIGNKPCLEQSLCSDLLIPLSIK
jgi:hypothetical protein